MDPLTLLDLDDAVTEHTASSKLSSSSADLDIAYREYERAIADVNQQMDRIFRIAAIGFSAAGVILYLALERDIGILTTEWSYWIAPLLLAMFYSLVIQNLNNLSVGSYYIRQLEKVLSQYTSLKTFNHQHSMVRTLYSIRTGDARSLVTYVIILGFATALYLAIILVGYQGLLSLGRTLSTQFGGAVFIDSVPDWRERAYLGINFAVMALLLWAGSGTMASRKSQYEYWFQEPDDVIGAKSDSPAIRRIIKNVMYVLLPRRMDFVAKFWFISGGYVFACFVFGVGVGERFSALIWLLIVIELLAKQSTYMWNDILDMSDDVYLPTKGKYRLQGMGLDRKSAIRLFLLRSIASIYVAWIVGEEFDMDWLVWLVCLIFAWQFVYDRWAKRRPVRRLVTSSLSYGMRVAIGANLALTVIGVTDIGFISLAWIWASMLMFAILAQYWWAEHVYLASSLTGAPTPKSIWNLYIGKAGHEFPGEHWRDWSRDWFIQSGAIVFRRTIWILVFVSFILTFFYGSSDSQVWTIVRPSLRRADTRIESALASWFTAISDLASHLLYLRSFAGDVSVAILIGTAFLSGVVSIAVVLRFSKYVRGRVEDSATRQNGAWPRRLPVAGAWLALGGVFLWVLPPEVAMIAIVPTIIGAVVTFYELLSHVEAVDLERILHESIAKLPLAIRHALFSPWAVRIVIAPGISASSSEAQDAWMKELQDMYFEWAKTRKLEVRKMKGDGGFPYDLIIEDWKGGVELLHQERGLHNVGADAVVSALVLICPVPVLSEVEMGSGLKVPRDRDIPSLVPFLEQSTKSDDKKDTTTGRRFTYSTDRTTRESRGEEELWTNLVCGWQPNREVHEWSGGLVAG